MTGSLITSIVNGHSKTKEAPDPADAGSACDMLSAGAGAGASSAVAGAAVEAAVSAAPDDAYEGDKLKAFETGHKYCLQASAPVSVSGPPPSTDKLPSLDIKSASASAVAAAADMMLPYGG